jgi:hypothetical protein
LARQKPLPGKLQLSAVVLAFLYTFPLKEKALLS